MFDQDNTTYTLSLDDPISNVFAKEIEDHNESIPYTTDDCCSSDVMGIQGFKKDPFSIFPNEKQPTLKDWMVHKSIGLSKSLLIAIVSSQVDLTHLTSNDSTRSFDQEKIINIISEKQSINVTISKDLIMDRSKTRASSFLGPSGAYLTWLEMFGEVSYGDK